MRSDTPSSPASDARAFVQLDAMDAARRAGGSKDATDASIAVVRVASSVSVAETLGAADASSMSDPAGSTSDPWSSPPSSSSSSSSSWTVTSRTWRRDPRSSSPTSLTFAVISEGAALTSEGARCCSGGVKPLPRTTPSLRRRLLKFSALSAAGVAGVSRPRRNKCSAGAAGASSSVDATEPVLRATRPPWNAA